MPSSFTQSALAGAQISGQAFERRLRAQEQRSREAQRIMQERLLAQQIEDLERKEAESKAQQEALKQAAQRWQQEMASEQSFEQLPEGVQGPPKPMPKLSPGEAFLKHYLPEAKTPEQARQFYEAATKFEAENDPNSFINRLKAGQLQARQDELLVEKDRRTLAELQALLRRSGQSLQATKIESELAKEGQQPKFRIQPPDISGALPSTSAAGTAAPADPAPFEPTLQEAPRRPTQATISAAQKGVQNDVAALDKLNEALEAAKKNPEAFGVRGKVEGLLEKAKGQINPRAQQAVPISDTQQKAAIAFAAVVNSLKVDSQLNVQELAILKQGGETLSAEESAQTAQSKMENLISLSLRSAIRKTKLQGHSIEPLLRKATVQALFDAVMSGDITREEAFAETERRK